MATNSQNVTSSTILSATSSRPNIVNGFVQSTGGGETGTASAAPPSGEVDEDMKHAPAMNGPEDGIARMTRNPRARLPIRPSGGTAPSSGVADPDEEVERIIAADAHASSSTLTSR